MPHPLRSLTTIQGRRMAGARSLWRANGMKEEQFGRPVIAIVNSFTQFVPGHVHLHEIVLDSAGLGGREEFLPVDHTLPERDGLLFRGRKVAGREDHGLLEIENACRHLE